MPPWVLIVDDDPDNRELLLEFLEASGYLAVSCGTAADADRILDTRGRPGLVLADVALPDMLGTAFIKAMKSRPGFEDTPVIFLTGFHPSHVEETGDSILTKPVDLDVLMNMVSGHCDATTPPPS
jgi:CheY-like chemotaxis protein